MFDLLFLLLPIAAGYGWYMGSRSVREKKEEDSYNISKNYIQGLNLLLADKTEKALEVFINLLELDDDTLDTHLTLGNLFRQNGEIEKAIKIHKSLLSREGLTFNQNSLILQELAKDYYSVGLYDRSEKIYSKLLEQNYDNLNALQNLANIYIRTRDWEKAISITKINNNIEKKQQKTQIAQFYCELASNEFDIGNYAKTESLVKKALSENPDCVRASLLMCDILSNSKQEKKLFKQLELIVKQDIRFVIEIRPFLVNLIDKIPYKEITDFFDILISNKAGTSFDIMYSNLIEKKEGFSKALAFMDKQINANPSMKNFAHLILFYIKSSSNAQEKNNLIKLQALVQEEIKTLAKYQCSNCGFETNTLFWNCPSCHSWETIIPVRGLKGE